MAKANRPSTQIKVTPVEVEIESVEETPADDSSELSPEEQALAEESLSDLDPDENPDDWGHGGAQIGDVLPEDEEAPAYAPPLAPESEVVQDGQAEVVTDGTEGEDADLADDTESFQLASDIQNPPPDLVGLGTETSADKLATDQPQARTRNRRKLDKQPDPNTQPTEDKSKANLGLQPLEDGNMVEEYSHAPVQPAAQIPGGLPDEQECSSWLALNNLTCEKLEPKNPNNPTIYLVLDGHKNNLGAGCSMPMACHNAGMRTAEEMDADVDDP